MAYLDHVLFISRTKLPYNFEGLRKGGAPNWIRSHIVDTECEFLKESSVKTEQEILAWLKETLPKLELPRKNKPEEFNVSISQLKSVIKIEKELIDASVDKVAKEYENDIFVSYLSRESRFRNARFPIEEVLSDYAEIVPNGHFIYAPPGDISNEIMSERRRWEIVSSLDRQMSKCKAVVLYRTEGYSQSWWTTAEMISLAYRLRSNRAKDIIYIIDDRNKIRKLETQKEIQTFLPQLTEEQFLALTRRFAHSDPLTMSYEYDDLPISELPDIAKKIVAAFSAGWLKVMEHIGLFEESYTSFIAGFKQAKDSLESYVKTPEFMKSLVFDAKHSDSYTVDDFINLAYTYRIIPEFYDALQEHFSVYPDTVIPLTLPDGRNIKIRKNGEYYRFLQPRFGKVVNKEGLLIKKIHGIEQV